MGEGVEGGFRIGDRVVSEQIVPCGKCRYCRAGKYWLCDPHDVYGFKNHLQGGMAEYAMLPKRSINYRVPKELPLEKAVLIEPFACSQLSPYCYSRTIEGIASGALPTEGVVSHVFPLDKWAEAFAVADSGKDVKVILKP